MMTVVTVGNTATREIAGRMVTPRGYRWQDGALPQSLPDHPVSHLEEKS